MEFGEKDTRSVNGEMRKNKNLKHKKCRKKVSGRDESIRGKNERTQIRICKNKRLEKSD